MISYYELLNMIKEEKAPKEIKFRGVIYKAMYDCCDEFSYYYIKNVKEIDDDCRDYLAECFLESNMFDKNIEVINKIEKISLNDNGTLGFPNGCWTARNMDKAFAIKINEIIDKLERIEK